MKAAEKKRQTARRGRGEGSIFQRGDGRWCAIITVGRNERGKRLRKSVYGPTKKAVQDKLMELHGQKRVGALREVKRMTVGDYLGHWLKTIEPPTVRLSTHTGYTVVVDKQLKPHLGGLQLSALSSVHIEGMLSALRDDGQSPRAVQMAYVVLRIALGRAVKAKLIPFNPCADVDRPAVPRKEVEPYSTDQIRELLTAAESDRLRALYVLAVTTGMRQGELFGLKWDDIDLERGTLVIRRSLVEINNKPHWSEPKSATSRRRIELPAMAVEALQEHRVRMGAEALARSAREAKRRGVDAVAFTGASAGSDVVFPNSDGGLLTKSNFRWHSWLPLLKRAGLPQKRFHDLRHSAASMLCELGVHPKLIQARLGHADIGTTMNVYGHLMPGQDRGAADRLGNHLGTKTA